MKRAVFVAFAIVAFVFQSAAFAEDVRTARVRFAHGASQAAIQGVIKGRQSVDYKVGASAGQTMIVTLSANNESTYFNIFEPGAEPGTSTAIFASDRDGDRFERRLASTGDYTIQVYLYRNEARRGGRSQYTLDVAVEGAAASTAGAPAGDVKVAGTNFHATGQIPCAEAKGQPMAQCDFGVSRAGAGTATVVVTLKDGRRRAIFFDKGKAMSADTSQADGYGEFRARKEGDLFLIRVGEERYEIPEAVITGG